MDGRPRLATRLCEVLGIEYPIVQSGMGGVAGVDLAAEVCEAGGLGVLAGVLAPPDAIRAAIRDLRGRTTRPFGVNLLLATDLWPPAPAESIADETVAQVDTALNTVRQQLDLPPVQGRPKSPPNLVSSAIEVILEERVPIFSIGLGDPGADLVEDCHRRGIKVMAMVTTVADAMAVEDSGIDVIVAQGGEAGGHRSHFTKPPSAQHAAVGGMALIPEIAAAVRVPVVAAGGIVDGRGLVAALALGASGVLMGTRFVATQESTAPEIHKKA